MRNIIFALLLGISTVAQAEVFYDINFHDTLGDIKKKYPGATYKKLRPAWLKPNQEIIELSGRGIKNKINISFVRESKNFGLRYIPLDRPISKEFEDLSKRDIFKELANETISKVICEKTNKDRQDEEFCDSSILVISAEIVYSTPIPKERFMRRYGEPTSCHIDSYFDEICYFEDHALYATLSQNGRHILDATTHFTWPDKVLAYKKRDEPVPKWLEEIRY